MILWLKFLHIAAISIWVAGLFYLAAQLLSHRQVKDQQDFARVRMGSRFAYMGLVSPAAFIAVGTGGALLFVADALHPWMFVKLAAVGILVGGHMQYGYVLTHLAEEEAKGPTLRIMAICWTVVFAAMSILFLVLTKPGIPVDFIPIWLSEPGLLQGPASPVPPPSSPPPFLPS